MSFTALDSIFDIGKEVIERVWPDPNERAEQIYKLEQLRQDGDIEKLKQHVQLMTKQADINLADAQSKSKFQAWWRPSIGWVCTISLFLMYVPKAIVMTYIWTYQALTILSYWDGTGNLNLPAFPDLGVGDIIGLLGSMLGVAAMRSYDKRKGTDTKK